jgi:hypothetical protein
MSHHRDFGGVASYCVSKAVQRKLDRLDEALLCAPSIDIDVYGRHKDTWRQAFSLLRLRQSAGLDTFG